jgi:hypothetical protein
MPLQKLQFRPGMNREGTTLANEGGWYAGDKVRFRSGQVEKIGGWVQDTGTVSTGGNYIGVCRSLWNWAALNGTNYLGIGTNQKFYVQQSANGTLYDITPIRTVSSNATTFTATAGSNVVTVTNIGYNGQTGDFVTFSNATSLGGNVTAVVLNQPQGYQINYISTSQYSITVPVTANSSDTGNGGGLVTATYQISSGNQIYQYGLGWGAGEWGGLVNNPLSTSLSANLSNSATTVLVASTTSFPANGSILIGNELIYYASSNATAFLSCTRGYQNTVVSSYTTGAVVEATSTFSGWGQAAPASQGIGEQLRLWSQDNFGQNLIFNPRGGALYYWVLSANPGIYYPAQVLSPTNTNTQEGVAYWTTDNNCPTTCNYVLVSDASRFVIAFGCNDYGSTAQSPMLVRWSDQENLAAWTPNVTNQAGSYLLSNGSQIITAVQGRQEIVVFTDSAVYSMQYLGTPYVWGFQILSSNISIIGPNAAICINGVTYWMGQEKFYMYAGQVQTLPCTVREYIFKNINNIQGFQVFAGFNEEYNEIWWFYPSADSTVIDSYVIYNILEQTWAYGSMTRTAWIDSQIRGAPIAAGFAPATTLTQFAYANATTLTVANKAQFPTSGVVRIGNEEIVYTGSNATALTGCVRGYNGTEASDHPSGEVVTDIGVIQSGIVYHEQGNDDGTTNPPNPIYAYAQSSDFDIGDGHNFGFVWRIIPDVSFDGSSTNQPTVTFTTFPRQNPGSDYGSTDLPTVQSAQNYVGQSTFDVQQFTQYAFVRCRGRQMAFAISSDGIGVSWQLGNPRLDVRPDGRR